jgi:uncharacterized membrane protein YhhN
MTLTLVASAIAIAIFWGVRMRGAPENPVRAAIKTMPVALLALAALGGGAPPWLAIALALGAAGDGLLAFDSRRGFFLAGVAAFLLSHLAYARLFFAGADEAFSSGPVFLGATLLLFVLTSGIYRRLLPDLGDMKLPVAAYCAAILAMAVAALSRGLDPVLLPGVGLFMASDTALAFGRFAKGIGEPLRARLSAFVWYSYVAAQTLIAAAFLPA